MIHDEDIAALAAARNAGHKNGGTETFFGDKDILGNAGIAAERFFARTFGLLYDLKDATGRPQGDGGIDFGVPLKSGHVFTVNVKGATKKPYSLLVKCKQLTHHQPPDAYVVVGFTPVSRKPFFVGWERGHVAAKAEITDFGYGPGSECRIILRDALRPMREFCTIMGSRVDVLGVGPS